MAIPTMSLTAPTLADNTAKAVAAWDVAIIQSTLTNLNAFLQQLVDTKENTNFFNIGDLPFLDMSQIDSDAKIDVFDQRALLARQSNQLIPGGSPSIVSTLRALAALPEVPAAPTLAAITASVPEFTDTAPTIVLPATPAPLSVSAPTNQPTITDAVLPQAPVVALPAVPTFDQLQLPDAPTFSLPSFTSVAPQNLLSPPTDTFSYVDAGYVSELADPFVAKLLDQLLTGGYGIEPLNELALWNRARDRDVQASLVRLEEVRRQSAATSFPMPQGSYYAAIEAAQQELAAKVASMSREVALKRADMYVDNRRFTFEQVQAYEQKLIALYNAVQERAFNVSKTTVEMSIQIYNAAVENFKAELDAYRTDAQVFESLVRSQVAKAEIFKTQVEAESLRVSFNRAKIELYQAQLSGVQSLIAVYKAQLEAANTFTEIQAQKLQAFKITVDTYVAQVNAKEIEMRAYQAAVSGQKTAEEIYKTQVDAHNAVISGLTAKAEIAALANEQLLKQHAAQVQKLDADIKRLLANSSTINEVTKLVLEQQATDVSSSNAYTQAFETSVKGRLENARTRAEITKMNYQSQVDQLKFRVEELKANLDVLFKTNTPGTEAMRSLLASALANINSLAIATSTV